MPNHCWNEIAITGHRSDIDKFVEKLTESGKEFTFSTFVPQPPNVLKGTSGSANFVLGENSWEVTTMTQEEAEKEGLEFYSGRYGSTEDGVMYTEEEMKEEGLVDWYNWNLDNWGTKWDAYEVQVERQSDNILVITFDSAWSPPIPVIQAMQTQHPELSIIATYEEEGMMFQGDILSDGTVLHDDDWTPEEPDEEAA